jgi:hypothetical protein
LGARVWHDNVHYPDPPAPGRAPAERALAVGLEHPSQFLANAPKLLGREPEVSVVQDGISPFLGLGVPAFGELDGDSTGRVHVGRPDGCGCRGSGGGRVVQVDLDPSIGRSPRPLAAVGPRSGCFDEAERFQELQVICRRARTQPGQLCALCTCRAPVATPHRRGIGDVLSDLIETAADRV